MNLNKKCLIMPLATVALGLAASSVSGADDWKDQTISPVANPLFFEDSQISSEVRPVFLYHNISSDFVTQGGNVEVYAVQLRYALTDRLALIATKDGYIVFHPKAALSSTSGWADLAAGLKYALIDDKERQFTLTPGFKVTLPTGNEKVFQGKGKGIWDLFFSAEKGWDAFHLSGNLGFEVPDDFSKSTAQMHYSLQADYYCCQYFIPFVAGNAYTVLTDSKQLALGTEGYDLINFGTSDAKGQTQVALGFGFRSRLLKNLDLGFAYELGLVHPKGLFGDRYTVDLIWRF